MLTVSYAMWQTLKYECNFDVTIAAGHSLGEYSALVANESITFEDGLLLVKKRAELMSAAMENIDGTMAAVIGLDGSLVDEICVQSSKNDEIVEAVNFNCPGQTVIAGHLLAVDKIIPKLKEAGAKIIKKLPVSLAAHTSLLKPVAEQLKTQLQKIKFNKGMFDIVHNYDLSVHKENEELHKVLSLQVCSPVQWIGTLEKFKTKNITDVIEVGPGNVLSGLVKRCDKSISLHSTKSIDDIKMIAQAL